jgi:heat shock protein HslJ
MRHLRLALAAALVAGGLLAACQAAASPSLVGRTFLSVGITENGAPKALVAGTRIRLEFGDGSFNAHAGCNSMGGEYRLDGGVLIVTDVFTTEMACQPPLMAQDQWLIEVLGSKPSVTLAGDQLAISGGGVLIQLMDRRVVDPDRAITGPTWTVDSIFSGDAVSSVPQGAVATLVFHEDGTLDVETSCNTGQGRWKAVGQGIEVTGLGLTKRGCIGPNGDLEAAVVATLGAGTIAAAIEADQLILRAGANGLGLRAR